jgi:hypothetical protein
MFLLFELSQALFLVLKGAGKEYWKGNLVALSELPNILRKRRAFQRLKVKRDRDWLRGGSFYLPNGLTQRQTARTLLKFYCGFFDFYWKLIRPLC